MPSGVSYGVLGSVVCNGTINTGSANALCRTPVFGQGFKVTHVWANLQSTAPDANTTITVGRELIGANNTANSIGTFVLPSTAVNGDVFVVPLYASGTVLAGTAANTDLAPGESIRIITAGASNASTWTFGVYGYETPPVLPTNTSTTSTKTNSGTASLKYLAFTAA